MKALTEVQQNVLSYIRDFVRDNGYPPTIREIQHGAGLSGPSHVYYHLGILEREGYIRRAPDSSRAVEVVADAEMRRFPALVNIPIMGTIAAGQPIEAYEAREELQLSRDVARNADFALRVRGTSMLGDHIEPGDLVIVRRQDTADDGDTVVALLLNGPAGLAGEATLKRFYRESPRQPGDGGRIRLEPRNPTMEPIVVEAEQVRIQGKVVGVVRMM